MSAAGDPDKPCEKGMSIVWGSLQENRLDSRKCFSFFALSLLPLSPSHVCVSVRARCVFGADT